MLRDVVVSAADVDSTMRTEEDEKVDVELDSEVVRSVVLEVTREVVVDEDCDDVESLGIEVVDDSEDEDDTTSVDVGAVDVTLLDCVTLKSEVDVLLADAAVVMDGGFDIVADVVEEGGVDVVLSEDAGDAAACETHFWDYL